MIRDCRDFLMSFLCLKKMEESAEKRLGEGNGSNMECVFRRGLISVCGRREMERVFW